MTHSAPWAFLPSTPTTAFLTQHGELTAAECRELAKQLANVAEVLDGNPLADNERIGIVRVRTHRGAPFDAIDDDGEACR